MYKAKKVAKKLLTALLGLTVSVAVMGGSMMSAEAGKVSDDVQQSIAAGKTTVPAMFCVLRKGEALPDETQIANRSTLKFYNAVTSGEVLIADADGNLYSYTDEYPYEDKGFAEYAESSRLLPGYSGDVDRFVVGSVDLSPIFNDQNPLKNDEYVRWYVIKRENDCIHVDGVVEKKPYYNIVINYGYFDGNGNFAQFMQETFSVMMGEEYTKNVLDFAGYSTTAVRETFVADADKTLYVEYSPVAVPGGPNIVPTTPTINTIPATQVADDTIQVVDVIMQDDTIQADVQDDAQDDAVAPEEEVVPVEVPDDTVTIDDEDTARTDAPVLMDTVGDDVVIEDAEVPLAGRVCHIHNILLLLLAAYTAYQIARAISRNKKISNAVKAVQSVNA